MQFIFQNKFKIDPLTAFNGKIALDLVISNIQSI